ncbi:unnamed protein product, partial [Amoebophrya sp. A120]|eukprot:GSA120T00022862001.1
MSSPSLLPEAHDPVNIGPASPSPSPDASQASASPDQHRLLQDDVDNGSPKENPDQLHLLVDSSESETSSVDQSSCKASPLRHRGDSSSSGGSSSSAGRGRAGKGNKNFWYDKYRKNWKCLLGTGCVIALVSFLLGYVVRDTVVFRWLFFNSGSSADAHNPRTRAGPVLPSSVSAPQLASAGQQSMHDREFILLHSSLQESSNSSSHGGFGLHSRGDDAEASSGLTRRGSRGRAEERAEDEDSSDAAPLFHRGLQLDQKMTEQGAPPGSTLPAEPAGGATSPHGRVERMRAADWGEHGSKSEAELLARGQHLSTDDGLEAEVILPTNYNRVETVEQKRFGVPTSGGGGSELVAPGPSTTDHTTSSSPAAATTAASGTTNAGTSSPSTPPAADHHHHQQPRRIPPLPRGDHRNSSKEKH